MFAQVLDSLMKNMHRNAPDFFWKAINIYATNQNLVALLVEALTMDPDCKARRAIDRFLANIRYWEKLQKDNNNKMKIKMKNEKKKLGNRTSKLKKPRSKPIVPLSANGLLGFKVTLRATKEVCQELSECGFQYLRTSRLSQDPLEKFFSIMRSSCGSNDHPDPKMFSHIYKLVGLNSLVRPPKGSNVSGAELLGTLMQAKDALNTPGSPRKEWLQKIDNMIDSLHVEPSPDVDDNPAIDNNYNDPVTSTKTHKFPDDTAKDHNYNVPVTSEEVQAFVAGYILRRFKPRQSSSRCVDCFNSIKAPDTEVSDTIHQLTDMIEKYGCLLRPCKRFVNFTGQLESAILYVAGSSIISINTMHDILDKISAMKLELFGCTFHQKEFTKRIIDIYVVTRGNMLAATKNKEHAAKQFAARNLRKQSKLITPSAKINDED